MGLHEPDYVNEPEYEVPAWLCLVCGHSWVPEEGEVEQDEGALVFIPKERTCPVCGSEETDER